MARLRLSRGLVSLMATVRLPASLSPLGQRNFLLLWMGQAVSAFGDGLLPVALAFAALEISHSATALGAVLAVSYGSRIVVSPVGGVWSDRLPRQLVMLASDGVRGAVQIALGAVLISGHAQLWHLLAGMLLFGAASGFFQPAAGALVPQTVTAERLQQANALMGLARSTTGVLGPALSGVLVALFSPGWCFAIDGATFVVSAISLALLRMAPIGGTSKSGFWAELADGLRAVVGRRWYLLNLGAHAMWNLGLAATFVMGPIVAKDRLGGASAWGLITAAQGVGSIVGGLIALRLMPRRPLIAANLSLVPAALIPLAFAVPEPTAVIMAVALVGMAGLTFLNEVWFATVPQLMPPEVLARVTSLDWFLSLIVMPVGYSLAGPLADRVGIRPTLALAALAMSVPCLLIVFVPGVRRVKRGADGLVVMEAAA